MTTLTAPVTGRSAAAAFVDAVRAEWTKIVTLPATWVTIGGTAVFSAVLSLFFASQARSGPDALGFLDVGLAAIPYSQAGLFVLGVIIACSEQVGGQYRTTLIAMPHRVTQRAAALAALVLVGLPAAVLVLVASLVTTAAVRGGDSGLPPVGSVLTVVVVSAIYLTFMVVASAAVGDLTRRALPAAGTLVLYLVVVSPMLLGQPFAYYLPDVAGYTLLFTTAPAGAPPAAIAWLVVAGWTAVLWLIATVVAVRRDA